MSTETIEQYIERRVEEVGLKHDCTGLRQRIINEYYTKNPRRLFRSNDTVKYEPRWSEDVD